MPVSVEEAVQNASEFQRFLQNQTFGSVLLALIVLVGGILLTKLFLYLLSRFVERKDMDQTLWTVIRRVLRLVLYYCILRGIAYILHVEFKTIYGVVAVLLLALALAAQDSLAHVVGGVMILSAKLFRIGDYIETNGQEGFVRQIGLAYTTLQTRMGSIVYLPNNKISSGAVVNYSQAGKRWLDLLFTADYACPTETVIQALEDAAKATPRLENEPIFTGVREFCANDIRYELAIWVKPEEYWVAYDVLSANVRAAYERAGVRFSYPHVVLHTGEEQ